jgi:uncharacterized protein YcbK (DUF882 family)
LTGNDVESRAGRHMRWLAMLVAATSLSGCMASALDTSAIQVPDAGQTFAYADEDARDAPRPPEYLITGSTDLETQAVPITPPGSPDVAAPGSTGPGAVAFSQNAPQNQVAPSNRQVANSPMRSIRQPPVSIPLLASRVLPRRVHRSPVWQNAREASWRSFQTTARQTPRRLCRQPPWSAMTPRLNCGVRLPATAFPAKRPVIASAGASSLPGVDRERALGLKSETADENDLEGGPIRLASAAGLARLAPNGLKTQTESVDVACLKPALVRVLKKVEQHYGRDVIITSGYRNPTRNKKASGSSNSLHMYCSAADIQIQGVTKTQLAEYLRSMPGRGGVGTYCHTASVHIDIGPQRDWNWRCRRKK